MRARQIHRQILAILLASAALVVSGSSRADPPAQAARLAYIAGDVSFSRSGDDRWVQARLNRPLTVGDRLWTDGGARAEIQVGGAVLRMDENTSVEILNLTDGLVQVQVDEGKMNVRVRRLGPRQSVEITTPNLAFTVRRPASYRIDVDPLDDATAIVVRSGRGEVYGDRASYSIDSRQSYRFGGTGLRSYEYIAAPRLEEFDRWGSGRDRRTDASVSARYVSRDVIGYEDLDANGTWRNEPGYGRVWAPTRVAKDWTPYRDGHWTWVEPWGWSWVDDAPWGYAVSHYGRWANTGEQWVWVPAPVQSRAVYAPALVGFTGGGDFQAAQPGGPAGGVAWVPLGPREVYRPPYQVSRGYFDNINRSNTNVPPATINNAYSNVSAPSPYVNLLVVGAIVAVAATVFLHSQNVAKAAVPAPVAAARTSVAIAAPAAPAPQIASSAAPAVKAQPPVRARERRIVAQSTPPASPAPSAAQKKETAATPTPKPAANVIVVTPPQATPPTAPPPAKAPEGKPVAAADKPADRKADERKDRERKGEGRKGEDRKAEDRKPPAAAPTPATPATPKAAVPIAAPAAPAPIAPVPDAKPGAVNDKSAERKGSERKGDDRRSEDRKSPAAASAPVAPPSALKPVPTVPAPAVKPPAAAPTPTPAKAEPGPAAKAAPDAGKQIDGRKDDAKRDDRKRIDAKRADEDNRRAGEDKRRAGEDKRRAGEDKRRASGDKGRAEDNRKSPEGDTKRAEEDKKRVEEDKRRADEDKRRVEEDKRRVEEDKRK
ncbi:MAG: DUF6600 domain-containing protein [Betaproteobacteria bacterium]